MLIYRRYIIKIILPYLALITFALSGIIWLTQVMKLLYLIDKGIRVSHFLNVALLVIPSLLFVVLPFATVCAVIYSYHQLNEERQLIILKSAGISNFQLAIPALFVGCLATVLSYCLSVYLLPLSYSKLKTQLELNKNNYAFSIINEKTFSQLSKSMVIYVNKKLPNNVVNGLVLFDNRNKKEDTIIFAEIGKFKSYPDRDVFYLQNGARQAYDFNGNLTRLYFKFLTLELTNAKLQNQQQQLLNRDINEYYIGELLNPDNKLPAPRKHKLIAEGHQRLIWPLYNTILPFIALAVLLSKTYGTRNKTNRLLITIISTALLTGLHFSFHNVAAKDVTFSWLCYANLICSVIAGVFLYLHKRL